MEGKGSRKVGKGDRVGEKWAGEGEFGEEGKKIKMKTF